MADPADTSRIQAERALRESEQRFRLVVEAAPAAMVMTDRAGEIVMINAQAERVLGTRGPSLWVGRSKCSCLHDSVVIT